MGNGKAGLALFLSIVLTDAGAKFLAPLTQKGLDVIWKTKLPAMPARKEPDMIWSTKAIQRGKGEWVAELKVGNQGFTVYPAYADDDEVDWSAQEAAEWMCQMLHKAMVALVRDATFKSSVATKPMLDMLDKAMRRLTASDRQVDGVADPLLTEIGEFLVKLGTWKKACVKYAPMTYDELRRRDKEEGE